MSRFRSLFIAGLSLLAGLPATYGFSVTQQVEALVRPIIKPNNQEIVTGEVTIKVGYFSYDLANLANNNAQIVANAANPASLAANFQTFWTFTGAEGDNGAPGVNGELGANAGGAGLFYTYFLTNDTAMTTGGPFNIFAGKVMYCWVQLVSDPGTQAIFMDALPIRFAGGTDAITDANAALDIQPSITTLQVVVGNNTAGGYQLLQAASTAVLAFTNSTSSVVENAGTVMLTVTRSGKTDNQVTVQYTTGNGSAIAGTDYTTTNGTLTFFPSDTSETITVPIADRPGFQGNRDFTVTLSNPSVGAELGSPSINMVTITDDETAMPGQLVLSSATYSVAENGGQVAVTVQRIGGTDGAVSATLASADGSANAGQDFTAVNQSVMFAAGDAVAKVINVAITNDAMFEGNETFTVALSAPQGGATIGAPGSATVTINEDDAPPSNGALSFTSATYNAAEDGGTVTITVQRTLGSTGTVGVTYGTTNGSAIAGTDYTNTTGMLSWGDGDTANKTFTVPIIDNINDEADKTFQVVLTSPTGGAALAAPSSATVTINDDDIAGTLAWSVAASNVNENAGNAVLTITRTGGTDGAVAVTVNTANGTATAGTDYTAVTNATANFANGQASAMVSVPITDNATFQGNRDFTVTLSAPTNGAVLGAPATQTVTIVEDDTAMPGVLAFSAANYTVDEASGTATITVVRSGGSDTTVTVNYAATAGTANAGDFTETMGILTFVAGDLSESFTITINNDTIAEPNETVNLALSNPTNGATLGTPNTATLTIVSEDEPPFFRLSAAAYGGTEGTTVSVIVQRVGGLDQTLTVNYATQNGTALAGSDYKNASGTLTFGPNETEMPVPVELKLDTVPESAEKFKFVLSAPSQGATLGTPSKATITIARNGAIDKPDNAVATEPYHRFAGKDVYNTSGNGQVASKYIKPGGKAVFTLRVANNGNLPDSLKVVAAPSGTANGAKVRIFYRGNEVTARMTSPDGFTVRNLERKEAVEFEVIVKFNGGLANTGYGATFTTTSVNTPTAIDVARVVAIIRN